LFWAVTRGEVLRGEIAPVATGSSDRHWAFIQLNSSGQVTRFDTMPDMQSELTEQAKKLSISDRINPVEEIWDTIAEENQAFELSDAQKRELDRRLESTRSNAGQAGAFGQTWEEIKAEFMKSR
jgi:putative addiction module component (TIGR02574 family)